jgi:pyruvate dehydrogenase E1 component beta subunit
MAVINCAQALIDALREEMQRDETVYAIGTGVYSRGGTFGQMKGLGEEFGKNRFWDSPISESAIMGSSVGAAATGLRPIAEMSFCDFMGVAMDQICNQAAKMRYMFGGNVKLPLVITATCGAGFSAAAQHSQCLEALFIHIPGLKVVMPSNPYDFKGLFKSSVRDDNPVLFLEHKVLLQRGSGEVPEEEYTIPLGVAEVKREGEDVTIVAWARMVEVALSAAERLAGEGISAEVVDPRTLKPLDVEAILSSVEKTGRLIILHEACRTTGFGAEIAAIVADEGFDHLEAPVKRITAPDTPVPFSPVMEQYFIPDEEQVIAAVEELFQ